MAGRQAGSSRTPSALFARFPLPNTVDAANVSASKRPVIAVLPLKNLSAEPDSDYFVDGLTDEIIRNLAVIKGLEVRSRTSFFAFKDKPRNLRDIGEQLGVTFVVDASIMRSGSAATDQRAGGAGRRRRALVGRAVRSGGEGRLRHTR